MKKRFSILLVSIVILGLTLSLSGVLVSQAAPNEGLSRPIPATDVKIVKKIPLPVDVGEIKGKPQTPPGKDKNGSSSEGKATGILGESLPLGASKYAIVIGICDYPGTRNDIGDCKSDGDSLNMVKALILYGYDPNNIYLFKDMGGTTGSGITGSPIVYSAPQKGNILNAIKTIGENTTIDGEVVFFFSGHGVDGIVGDGDNEGRDEGILVHKDNASDLDSDYDFIWDGELKQWFNEFVKVKTSRVAFVFDSCLAGGMNDVADTGRVVSMGTNETQPAYVFSTAGDDVDGDDTKDGEGVFTHYFVNKGMLKKLADKYYEGGNHYGQVVLEEAFNYAKEVIGNSIYKRQKPTISDRFENDLLLGY